MSLRIIQGPNAKWHAVVIGHDLLVRGALATNWGDKNDPQDNGQASNGLSTANHPGLLACSLPTPYPGFAPTAGGPLPLLPWGLDKNGSIVFGGTMVRVSTPDGKSALLPLIDRGPALDTNHPIDLTDAAFEALGGVLSDGILSVDFLIINGAKFLPGERHNPKLSYRLKYMPVSNLSQVGGTFTPVVLFDPTTGDPYNATGGGGGGSNAAAGANGGADLGYSSETGFINGSGKLTAVSASTPFPVTSVAAVGALVDGSDVTLGAKADAAVTNPASSGSVIALLKGIISSLETESTGAATSALQTTGNSSLATIATNTTGVATAANQALALGSSGGGTAAVDSLLVGGTYNSTPLALTTGQQAALQADPSGTLQVATASGIITVTPTVTAATYAANKVLGGVMTLTGALRAAKNSGILNSIMLNFNTTAPIQGFTVALFSANPTASTFTDNVIAAINSADVGKRIALVQLSAPDSGGLLGTCTTYTASGIGISLSGTAGTLYAVVVCQGASVMAATTTFTNAIFGFLQD